MSAVIHPINVTIEAPSEMNNPFDYEPHPLCLHAAEEVRAFVSRQEAWLPEIAAGKMFGVLVVESSSEWEKSQNQTVKEESENKDNGDTGYSIGYLAAYSGQILGRSDWDGFVPAVFDYLQPEGYFKHHETEIDGMTETIRQKKESPELLALRKSLRQLQSEAQTAILHQQQHMLALKSLRDRRRKEVFLSEREQAELIKESQFQKAELKRLKNKFSDEIEQINVEIRIIEDSVEELEQLRKQKSVALQQWLFSQFVMWNYRGEKRSLLDIFSDSIGMIPPSGAGECCEPKLLQYAYQHGLRPLCMAMFWMGDSPKGEIRHAGQFYPACRGKCRPILQWMLPPGVVRDAYQNNSQNNHLSVIYEDDALLVVNKPAGLLSVPGKVPLPSVYSLLCERLPEGIEPFMVHRLDMATSGLMVVAKSRESHKALQQQFIRHTVHKEYTALLDGPFCQRFPSGTITLPLRPDIHDRPRQIVDHEHGRRAITHYELIEERDGKSLLRLTPETGRTHQLRVHCAHPEGLNQPILGDELYGRKAARLYLHASFLSFRHSVTNQPMTFSLPFDCF